jgi:hypothetical protein
MPRGLRTLATLVGTLATALAADYQAGVARLDVAPNRQAQAVVIQDSKGGRVVILTMNGSALPPAFTDLVAARTGLSREQLLFRCGGAPLPDPVKLADALVTVTGAALGDLKPAMLWFSQAEGLRVEAPDRTLRVALFAGIGPAVNRKRVHGSIRAAFRMAPGQSVLHTREGAGPQLSAYPIQAIRFGASLTLLALGGEASPTLARRTQLEFPGPKDPIILLANSNAFAGPLPGEYEQAMFEGLRAVLKRVGR